MRDQPDEWWLANANSGPPARQVAWMLARVQDYVNLLRSMPWRIGTLPANRPLYATDSPLAGHFPPIRPGWQMGGFTELRYFAPLSPSVLLQIGPDPWRSGPSAVDVGARERKDFGLWEAEFAACVLSATAYRHAYGRARIVPQERARQWLDQYDEATTTWARTFLYLDPALFDGPRSPFIERRMAIRAARARVGSSDPA